MEIAIQRSHRVRRRVPRALGHRIARAIGRAARRIGADGDAAITVRFVDDQEMSEHHAVHLGGRKPTDVLAFPNGDETVAGGGDIVVNWDAVQRQAAARTSDGWSEEALSLVVHGLAHLSGHDHKTRSEARRMLRAERRAGRTFGLPVMLRPYGAF